MALLLISLACRTLPAATSMAEGSFPQPIFFVFFLFFYFKKSPFVEGGSKTLPGVPVEYRPRDRSISSAFRSGVDWALGGLASAGQAGLSAVNQTVAAVTEHGRGPHLLLESARKSAELYARAHGYDTSALNLGALIGHEVLSGSRRVAYAVEEQRRKKAIRRNVALFAARAGKSWPFNYAGGHLTAHQVRMMSCGRETKAPRRNRITGGHKPPKHYQGGIGNGAAINFGPKRALGIKNMLIGGMHGAQLKYIDVAINWVWTSLTLQQSPTPNCVDPIDNHLTPIPTGTSITTRQSNRVFFKSIQIVGKISCTQVSGSGIQLQTNLPVKLFLVLDTQCNGSVFTGYENECWASGVDAAGFAFSEFLRNMSYTDKYKVLREFDYNICAFSENAEGVVGVCPVNEFIPLNGIVQKWLTSATTGAVAGVVDNALHLAVSWAPGASNNVYDLDLEGDLHVRTRFYDV